MVRTYQYINFVLLLLCSLLVLCQSWGNAYILLTSLFVNCYKCLLLAKVLFVICVMIVIMGLREKK